MKRRDLIKALTVTPVAGAAFLGDITNAEATPAQAKKRDYFAELGVRTFKMFMTYQKLGRMTSDYYLAAAFDVIGRSGGMAMVHAENGLATDFLEDKFNDEGIPAIEAFTRMRPAALEAEAINRAIAMASPNCPAKVDSIGEPGFVHPGSGFARWHALPGVERPNPGNRRGGGEDRLWAG